MIPAHVDCGTLSEFRPGHGETAEPSDTSRRDDLYRNNIASGTFLHCGDDDGGSGPMRVMSNLVVFDFDGIHTADEVLNKLRSLEKEYLVDLDDACVVEGDEGGKVHIKQAVNLAGFGAAMGGMRGALWGTLAERALAAGDPPWARSRVAPSYASAHDD